MRYSAFCTIGVNHLWTLVFGMRVKYAASPVSPDYK